jgi:hypothetical protein
MTSRIVVIEDSPVSTQSLSAIARGAARGSIELRRRGPVNNYFPNARIP